MLRVGCRSALRLRAPGVAAAARLCPAPSANVWVCRRWAATKQQIAQVRELAGAGLLDCKRAVEATDGDIDKALEWLQERGMAKAAKKRDRSAAAGVIAVCDSDAGLALVEVNTETDFVARAAPFADLVGSVREAAPALLAALPAEATDEQRAEAIAAEAAIAAKVTACIAQMGENVRVRRALWLPKPAEGAVGAYAHNKIKSCGVAGATVAVASIQGEPFSNQSVVPCATQQTADRLSQHIVAESLSGDATPLLQQQFMQSERTVKGWLKGRAKMCRAKQITVVRTELWRCGQGIETAASSFADEVAQLTKAA